MKLGKVLAIPVLALISLVIAGPALIWTASANTLVSTSPASGASLKSSPSSVTITAESPLLDLGNSVSVTDPYGARVDDGTLTVSGSALVAGLKLLTVSGVYKVSYELLADNDVPLIGSFTFNFTAPSVVTSPSPTVIIPSATPNGGITSEGAGVPPLVIALILAALVVLGLLILYAWKLISKK